MTPASDNSHSSKPVNALEWASRYFRKALIQDLDAKNKIRRQFAGISDETFQRYALGVTPTASLFEAMTKAGFSDSEIESSGLILHHSGNSYNRFRNRATLPVRDGHGEVVGFAGRLLDDDFQPKYLHNPSAEFFCSAILYGMWEAADAIKEKGLTLMVPGYTDLFSLVERGVGNVVCYHGCRLPEVFHPCSLI